MHYGYVYNEITIDNSFLIDNSEVSIATVIIHEIIHAFLNVTRVNPDLGLTIQTLSTKDFAACINSCYDGLNEPMSQHNFMTDYMAPVIADILIQIKSSLFTAMQINKVEHPSQYNNYYLYSPTNIPPVTNSGIATQWIWNDFFINQSYEGLQNCNEFNNIFRPGSVGRYYFDKYIALGALVFTP